MTESTKSKNSSLKGNKLNERLVFSRFSALAKKRDELYSDYIEIDEPVEIGTTWVEFSTSVVLDLLDVIDLTKSLFERLIDELRRSQDEPNPDELNRIKSLTSFWLDLSMVSYLYGTIEKRGVLDQVGRKTYSMGYVNTKKSLDELTLLAFQAGQEFFELQSRITLGEALSLNMEKKRLDFLDDVGQSEELRHEILGEYDKNQALFLMTRVMRRLIDGADSWWFMDPIAIHSASEHAISHIESMKSNWEQCTSDLIEKGHQFYDNQKPVAELTSKVALANHYQRLGMAALEARANDVAGEYFGKAQELTSSLDLGTIKKIRRLEIWDKSIPEKNLIYSQMKLLANISTEFDHILTLMDDNKIEQIEELLPKVLDNLSDTLSQGDIAYVSSVAIAYETAFVYIQEQLQREIDIQIIKDFVLSRMKTVATRLHKASHQMVQNWLDVVQSDGTNIDVLQDLIANIDYPLMAIFILPPETSLITSSSNELMSMQLATRALALSAKAEKEFGKNPVKEMLIRAKTYELTQLAMSHLNKITDQNTVEAIKSVLEPLTHNAFLRGLIAEIQLRTAVLQYRYINRIAPIIENSSLSQEKRENPAQHDREELSSFIESVEELRIAAQVVNDHKSPILIDKAPLNWEYIQKLSYFTQGLVEILKAIQHAIDAANTDASQIEDAITNWDEAKTLTFNAADIIAKTGNKEAEGVSQQVYTLAQIFYEFENKKRNRTKTEEFPVDGIIELVSTLLMGL